MLRPSSETTPEPVIDAGWFSMNNAEAKRAEELVKKAAHNALNRLKREHQVFADWRYTKIMRYAEEVLDKSISNQCTKILNAAKVKPAVSRQIEQEKERRKAARKELADELRAARAKLTSLQWKIQHAEKAVEEEKIKARKAWASRLSSAKNRLKRMRDAIERKSVEISSEYTPRFKDVNGYPAIPKPTDTPSKTGENLPYTSGIYFLWRGDEIEYVGQSKYLCNRLRLGNHHILQEDHMISFVLMDRKELTWAECYYIGICKPQLNFGRMASHHV